MGRVTISLDFELGWGDIESGLWKPRQHRGVYRDLRAAMARFVAEADDLEIPMTWATVGGMIADPSAEDFDHLPPRFAAAARDFLKVADAPSRDGRDLFDLVQGMKTRQDIGSHTFSHTRFAIADYDKAAKAQDMALSLRTLKARGVDQASFVFPLNQASDLDVLADAGVRVARLSPKRPKSKMGKMAELLKGYVPAEVETAGPNGLRCKSGSLLYSWSDRSSWPLRRIAIKRQTAKALRKAATSDYALHLWLHPFNLSGTPRLLDDISGLLIEIAGLRDAGRIDVTTMQA